MKKYLLIFICIFFLITRLYKIADIPPSVYWDEASIGYNAYSISQTGLDEWGKFLPIHFRAFGEFKLPLYIYAVVPFVKLLGLNELSVRLPAVLFSLGVVILTYLLAIKISNSQKIALFSAFLVSISPWFFIFSRVGYEVTAGLMFYLLGVYLFLTKKNSWYIFFSAISFIFSVYSYNSFRIIVPLTIPILLIIEFKNLKKIIRFSLPLILSIVVTAFSILPIYRLYKYDSGASRFLAVSANPTSFITNYLTHFDPQFLFINGDKNLRSQQSGFGQLFFYDLVLLPLGIIFVMKNKSRLALLVPLLIVISPFPAAVTKESPHALRAILLAPLFAMLSALGIGNIKNVLYKNLLATIIILVSIILFSYYFINFLTIYPKQSSVDWQFGYKKIYTDFKNEFPKYDQIVISDEYAQPYIFALFYLKVEPIKFRQTVKRNSINNWGFSTVSSFDNFKFGKIKDLINKDSKNTLIFAIEKEKISNIDPINTIKFPNGDIAFLVYKL